MLMAASPGRRKMGRMIGSHSTDTNSTMPERMMKITSVPARAMVKNTVEARVRILPPISGCRIKGRFTFIVTIHTRTALARKKPILMSGSPL